MSSSLLLRAAAVSLAALALIPVSGAEPAAPGGTRLSLRDALERGLKEGPDLAVAGKSVEAAEAHLGSTRAQRLPSIKLEGNVLRWNEELAFDVAPGAPPIVVREQVTTQASAVAALPITQQLPIHRLVEADRAALRAAEGDRAAAGEQLAAGIAQTYLGVLLARAQVEIATSRVTAVESQLERARVLADGGVLKRVDVLRLEAALAGARREVISAAAAAASGAEALALLIGLQPGATVAVVDDLPPEPKAPPIDADAAERGAARHRDDLLAGDARAEQARAGQGAARSALFPAITAVANYTRATGAGPFQPETSWYVGLVGSWDVWDWGKNYRLYKEAGIRAEQAGMAADRARDRARLEARKQARDASAAFQALAVARAGQAAADEAFRIQSVRFGEGDTTTTDLLQAETERAQAHVAVAAARHAYFVQLALLAQATGQRPDALIQQVR